MDRFTKIMLALIVCLLAIIAYKLPLHETAVLAAPTSAPPHITRYSYKLEQLVTNCQISWFDAQKDIDDGYEVVNLAGAPGANGCSDNWSVLLRKAQ